MRGRVNRQPGGARRSCNFDLELNMINKLNSFKIDRQNSAEPCKPTEHATLKSAEPTNKTAGSSDDDHPTSGSEATTLRGGPVKLISSWLKGQTRTQWQFLINL